MIKSFLFLNPLSQISTKAKINSYFDCFVGKQQGIMNVTAVQIIMRSKQQKQIESEGQFQEIRDQIQTLNASNFVTTLRNKTIRKTVNSEKAKLGLLQSSSISQCFYSPTISKALPQPYGKILKVGSATFRSNYECGHIGSVELIGINVFRIGLDEESNSTRGNTWFDFVVEGIKGQAKFIISGFTKTASLYNNGMKICCRDLKQDKWRRGGVNISYVNGSEEDQQKIYELHFTYFFKNNQQSSVQFAFAFPYGLKKLQHLIKNIQSKITLQLLGRSYEGRQIPLFNIGNPNSKELIILSSRVHPGQTCSSFIMEGLIKELLSDNDHAKFLRQNYYFKVVPMINIDGVVKGNYRFSASGVDLNRKWKQPSEQHQPQIYYLKEMILKESKLRKVKMYIDMHGHSRKKNVFFYGCSPNNNEEESVTQSKAFPFLMSKLHPAFSYFDCNFNIQKQKEGTARVSMWKQLKIYEIYTLQASMCGSQVGSNFNEADYQKIGKKLCEGMSIYFSSQVQSQNLLIKKLAKFKEETLVTLLADEHLRKIGTFQNSGSQSDPEKGENTLKEDKNSKQLNKRLKISTLHSNNRRINKNSSFKQKCQTSIPQQFFIYVKQKEPFQYLLSIPSQTINERKFHPPPMITTNKRAYSLSRNNNYHINAKPLYNQEEIYVGEQKSVDKNKANLLIGWQGAQYRRVRKVAEQNWKRQSSLGDFQLKGLRSNKLQIEKAISLIPKLPLNLQNKNKRNGAADMFFKKPQKSDEKISFSQQQMNVWCRGKQIVF